MSLDEQLQLAYWQTLFDPGDHVCVAKYPAGTSVRPLLGESSPRAWAQYVAINAFAPGASRSDAAVAKHRSFLVEFDDVALGEQEAHMAALELPWSTCVFSGGKSYHFLIVLDEPLAAADYHFYATWLLGTPGRSGAVPGADPACKNPSRFTRYPSVIRSDTGQVQSLVAVRPRVPLTAVQAWLQGHAAGREPQVRASVTSEAPILSPATPGGRGRLRNETLGFLAYGPERQRNTEVFRAACDFAACGYTEDEARAQITAVLPAMRTLKAEVFTEAELWRTIRSAYARVLRSRSAQPPSTARLAG